MFDKIFGKKEKQPSPVEAAARSDANPPAHVEPAESPFGEDIVNPDSRTIPPVFHGEWVHDKSECGSPQSTTRKVISSERLVTGDDIQRVVAVRFIDARQIAVVTLPADGNEQEYSLFYFGLSDDGYSLINLESTDWVLQRCGPNV